MLFKNHLVFFLSRLTYFKYLIYYFKKLFFSKYDKKRIKDKTKHLKKIFYKKKNNNNQILFNPVFGFDQIEYYEFLTYFLKIFELANYKPTIFSSYKSYEIFNSANFNLKENLIYYANYSSLKNFKNIKKKLNSINDIIELCNVLRKFL